MTDKSYTQIIKKLEKNFLKYSILITLVFFSIVIAVIYYFQVQKLVDYKQNISKDLQISFQYAQKNIVTSLSNNLNKLIHNKNIIELFYIQNREKLYLAVEDDFNFMVKNNIYIKVLHFHNADGTSFLRMHKSSKHSDNIALSRVMLQDIHKNHKKLVGYETGVYATVLRVIEPIFYNDKYIGAIEIGVDPNFILNYIETTTKEKGSLLFNTKSLELFTDQYDFELNGMAIELVLDKNKLNILKKLPKTFNYEKSLIIKNDSEIYYVNTLNILDFKGNSPAKLLFIKNITNFKNIQTITNISILVILFIIVIILFFFAKKYIGYFETTLNQFFSKIIEEEKDKKNYLVAIENSSSNFSITTDEKEVISINKAALDFLGYRNINDLKNEHEQISDFFIVKDGYIQKHMAGLVWTEYLLKNKAITNKVLLKKDDIYYTFLVQAEKFYYKEEQRYLVTFADITELEELEKKFRYIIQRNKFAEKGANIAIWDWNLTNDTVYYSALWKSILGYKDEEITDDLSQWHQRIHPEDVDKVISDLDDHFDGKNNYFINRHRMLHKNGKYIYTICRGKAIFEKKLPVRMVGIYADITEEQNAQDKIKEQEELMMAQSRHAAMGEMISMIAHQWRQPISSIAMGVNNVLLDIELDSLNKDDLSLECNEILDQTKYLSNTIEDFRSFFKEDKEKVLVSIESVIENSLKLMNKSLKNNNIAVTTEYYSTEKIETLPNEILQVLINLIKNAKEVLVDNKVENKYIKFYTTEDDNYIYVDIKDNGGGVKEENIHKIFQPYFTTKDEHNGTGLGLYMSKIIAQKHLAGDLSLKNSKDGAIFILSIKK